MKGEGVVRGKTNDKRTGGLSLVDDITRVQTRQKTISDLDPGLKRRQTCDGEVKGEGVVKGKTNDKRRGGLSLVTAIVRVQTRLA